MLRPATQTHAGFTVLELLVAIVATAAMLYVVDQLFLDTVRMMSQGAQISENLATSRTVSEQFQQDAQAMLPAQDANSIDPAGYLIIFNRVIRNVPVLSPDDPSGETTRDIRSDQLMFIRDARGLVPLTPNNTSGFANGATADYARVWYGHVLRTDPDGTGPAAGGLGTGPNRIGTNWILGRQALLLAGGDASQIHVNNGAAYNTVVSGYGSIGVPEELELNYMALSDVSDQTLDNLTGSAGVFTTAGDYVKVGYDHSFAPRGHVAFGRERLRVNPVPQANTFESWKIAQMHPYLAANVSDFIVEFAGDVDNNGKIDTYDNPENNDQEFVSWFGIGSSRGIPSWAGYKDHVTPGDHWPGHQVQANEDYRFTFRHDYPYNWPAMIRIRYRLHDPAGEYQEKVIDAGGTQTQSGQWFEQIIRVNRP